MDPNTWHVTLNGSELRDHGIKRWALSTELWVEPYRGVARPAGIALGDTEMRIADAVALMTPGCVLGGWAARYLQGAAYCDGIDRYGRQQDVLIFASDHVQLRKRPGIRPCERRLYRNEMVDIDGVCVTTLARSAYDDMLDAAGVHEAVVVAEMATSCLTDGPHTTMENLRHVVDAHKKTRGIVHVRVALNRSCERSASPWETRTRLVAEDDANIRGCLVNWPVFDLREHLLGIADLIDPGTGLVIESDGGDHRQVLRHNDDNVREEKFERSGLVVSRVSAIDHQKSRRPQLKQRLMSAQQDAKSSTKQRLWTLEQPGWWHTWEPGRRYRTP